MSIASNLLRLGPPNLPLLLVRFWGWTENEREAAMDLTELRARAQQGLPLYGESDQPEWIQQAAHSNSAFSQLKFRELVRLTPQAAHLFSPCWQRPSPCSFSQSHPYDSSLTASLGSTSSITHITVPTSLSTSNKYTDRAPHNISIYTRPRFLLCCCSSSALDCSSTSVNLWTTLCHIVSLIALAFPSCPLSLATSISNSCTLVPVESGVLSGSPFLPWTKKA